MLYAHVLSYLKLLYEEFYPEIFVGTSCTESDKKTTYFPL